MNRVVYIFLLLLFALTIRAQHSITGVVTDKSNGEPLIGVNIHINNLKKGAITDLNGNYKLTSLPKGELILSFSYVGFKTIHKDVYVTAANTELNVAMDILVIEGQEVVISGNFTSTQHDNTVKISIINKKELSQSIAPSLVESITEVPGVELISKGPGIGTPIIRGLSLSNILFLNNGVPLQNYQFSANHPYMIDENGIERVEIIKGPASLIYGSGAVGGVINLIGESIAKEGTTEADFVTKYYGNTIGVETNIGIKGNHKSWFWSVRGGLNSNKDYIQGNGKIAPNTRFNRKNIKITAGKITNRGSYKIIYQYNYDKLGLSVAPSLAMVKNNGRINEVWYQNLKNNLIISQNTLFLGRLKLGLNLSYQNNNRQLMGSEFTPVFKLVDMRLQTFSYRLKSTYSINEDLKIIFGVQGMFQTNKNFDAPDHVIPDANMWDISFYGLAQYNLGKAIIIEAGTRYDYKTIDVPFQFNSNGDNVEFFGDFSNTSVSLGTTIKLSEYFLFRVNFASAYRTPNIAELTQDGMHGTRYEIGNPNLNSQKNTEGDIGFHVHTKHTSLDVSAYYNSINNYIYLAPTNDTTIDGTKIYAYQQTPSYIYGGEIMLHLHPHPMHWLHIKTSYSYIIGKQKSGEYLPFIPAQKMNLEIRATKDEFAFFDDIFVLIGGSYVFPQNQPSEFEIPSNDYTLINVGVGFTLKIKNQPINLSLNISNLLNTEYISHLSTLRDLNIQNMGRSVNMRISIPINF